MIVDGNTPDRRCSGIRLRNGLLLALPAIVLGIGNLGGASAAAADRLTVQVGDARFEVELAQTLEERQRGLMFRTELAADRGMLFVQPQAGPAAFWMKNTYLPLDLLFFDADGRLLEIQADIPPCTTPSCPSYRSTHPVKYVLELNAGSAARRGLSVGNRLRLDAPAVQEPAR